MFTSNLSMVFNSSFSLATLVFGDMSSQLNAMSGSCINVHMVKCGQSIIKSILDNSILE